MSERMATLQQYVGDMVSLTKHIQQAVEKQVGDDAAKRDSAAYPIITRINATLERQIKELEMREQQLGGDKGSPIKEAVSSILGVAAGLIDKARSQKVSKMLRDDYTALSLAAMGFTQLHTTGMALKDQPTADLALSHLNDLTPLIMEISEMIPISTVKDLRDDSEVIDEAAVEQAIKNTQRAWSADKKAAF